MGTGGSYHPTSMTASRAVSWRAMTTTGRGLSAKELLPPEGETRRRRELGADHRHGGHEI
jgi:hypothetical protein